MGHKLSPPLMYGTAWKQQDTSRLVETALNKGFRAIDTANQPKHYSEALVGEALRSAAELGIKREDLFIQTKFTPLSGQDHRVPYNPASTVGDQVLQSFQNSLENLNTDYLDSYLLHGPYSFPNLGDEDWEVWRALEGLFAEKKVKAIGISNVTSNQLKELIDKATVSPHFVQNRCYASRNWDKEVREVCNKHNVTYQGFSLLTANVEVWQGSTVGAVATRLNKTPAQIIYRFAIELGMVPLTGTTNETHMEEALAVSEFTLETNEVSEIVVISS